MHTYDQLDMSSLASAEMLVRWLIQVEVASERNPRHPDYSGLDIVIAAPVTTGGRATTTKFSTWVTERMKERAQIWKQERLFKEERGKSDYAGGDGQADGGSGGGKGGGRFGGRKGQGRSGRGQGGADSAHESA